MKRLVGGDFLLNIATIFAVTSTLTNITNEEDISQLTNLKKYIPNPSMIKPIWVKLHDGDGKLVVTRGSLSVVDSDEFELNVILNGYTLKIHVKFTQMLNEDDDPIDDWYIATNDAKYLFTTNNSATFKVADVKNIDGEILSQLKCGDVIVKEDASGEHAYIVSYRGETGICLTYTDASVVETQSYDLVDEEWVYNSEDKNDFDFSNKDIIVKTIKQTNANYSLDLDDFSFNSLPSGVNCNIVYGRIEEINGVLYIVLTGDLENTNETSTSLTNFGLKVDLSEEIADKIYDLTGKKVSEVGANSGITADVLFKGDATYPNALNRVITQTTITNTNVANQFEINFYCAGMTINALQKQLFSFRTFLTIL